MRSVLVLLGFVLAQTAASQQSAADSADGVH